MKYTIIAFWCCVCYLASIVTLSAQQYQFQSYSLKDGIPQSQVNDIVQDGLGYLWLGTEGGGICRFDGKRFTSWNTQDGLLSNYIHALLSTKDSIFMGTRHGLSIKVKDGFTNFPSPQIRVLRRINTTIVAGTQHGLYTFTAQNGMHPLRLHPKIDSSTIHDIAFDGTWYWIATTSGLWSTTTLEENAETTQHDTAHCTALIWDQEKIMAATFNDGIIVLQKKTATKILIREPRRIRHLVRIQDQLWVATEHEGITVLDPNSYMELRKIDKSNGLSVAHIQKVKMDRQSNIWIATAGGGLYKYFKNHFKHYPKSTGLKGSQVHAIHHNGPELWVANAEHELIHVTPSKVTKIPVPEQFSETQINTLSSDISGGLWAGTQGSGIWYRTIKRVDSIVTDSVEVLGVLQRDTIRKTKIQNYIVDESKGLPSDWIRTLHVKGKMIWVASYSKGIAAIKYYPTKDSVGIRNTFAAPEGIKDLQILDLKEDPHGKMWYTTQHGYLGYIDDGLVTDLGQVTGQDIPITTLYFHQQYLFIGTAGLGVWWSKAQTPFRFQKLQGEKQLTSANVHQLTIDAKSQVWIGSERGLDRVTLHPDHTIADRTHFDAQDGVLGTETTLKTTAQDHQGNLWFGTISGLVQYQSFETRAPSLPPKVHFEQLAIAYTPVDTLNFTKWTNSDQKLHLQPHQNQLAFTYRTLDINHPDAVHYRFRLNTSEWSPWSQDNQQHFAGLAYGPHTFQVQSRNYKWQESDPIRFQFYIDPPLYRRVEFQWGVALVALFLCLGILLRYLNTIKRKNREAQAQLQFKNHVLALEHKALQLQMNPHFIFNVLNGIKAMSTTDLKKMNATLQTFALMLRETLHNSRKDRITLAQEVKTLKHYIGLEQLMSAKSFEYSLSTDSDVDLEEILIPPMLLQPFVENAIRHGILKGPREGELKIHITVASESETLQCQIQDNGIGIFQSQQQKRQTDHQSVALQVTTDRLISIAGQDALQMKELKNSEGFVIGTQITFTLPLETDY